ncbi:TrfB transcriptional repressor [Pseudomonas peli]|uniref:TrfB transcriptional repressor n=1 Tax=Pseudomonas peli TaxID=592361 RepID=A0AB37ZDX9_9PSED|nr:TrfB-related DNA-binding protein [Pseudomonas peli]NMZ71443.1 hypothetical protein [Pseudomonas peli]SCW90520.1 TrfB transcriptional repressor [Pseudomonas peli]
MTQSRDEDSILKMAAHIRETYTPAEIAQLLRLVEPTPPTAEMSPEDFEQLMQELGASNTRRGYSDKSIEAARLVLVKGASVTEAAAETNQTRQSVSQLMTRIRRRIEALPKGWVKVEQWLPEDVATQVESIAEQMKAMPKGKAKVFTITFQA